MARANDALNGEWKLLAPTFNCRLSVPDGDIVHQFKTGDTICVAEHVGNDWCLLESPAKVKGTYVRLRHGKNLRRSWERVQESNHVAPLQVFYSDCDASDSMRSVLPRPSNAAMLRILVISHSRNPTGKSRAIAQWLQSGQRKCVVEIQHYSTFDWQNLKQLFHYDACVLSGGSDVNGAICAKELKAVARMELPVLGICLGMQFICKAYSNKHLKLKRLSQSREWLREDVLVPELKLEGSMGYHRMYGVEPTSLPSSLTARQLDLAGKTVTVVQHKTKPVLGVQGHPESRFTCRTASQSVLRCFFAMVDSHFRCREG